MNIFSSAIWTLLKKTPNKVTKCSWCDADLQNVHVPLRRGSRPSAATEPSPASSPDRCSSCSRSRCPHTARRRRRLHSPPLEGARGQSQHQRSSGRNETNKKENRKQLMDVTDSPLTPSATGCLHAEGPLHDSRGVGGGWRDGWMSEGWWGEQRRQSGRRQWTEGAEGEVAGS